MRMQRHKHPHYGDTTPVPIINTTPDRFLAGMEKYIWDPEKQTFVEWKGLQTNNRKENKNELAGR